MKDTCNMIIPTYEDMLAAHERIAPHIRRTPVRTSDYLNELAGAELFFKCENFQEPGAFKVRGAANAVFGLDEARAAQGVATHSSGNHASCLSYAAHLRGIPCNVVMPRTAPQAKKDTVRRYGGRITECDPSTTSREETFAKVQAETGGNFVHPYNDPRVIAGQGTCAKELIEQTDGLDMVVAPIGGGGMISGSCLTLAGLAPETQVIAAEPDQADDAYRSFKAGHIIADDAPDTVADAPLGARILQVVLEYDRLVMSGASPAAAVRAIKNSRTAMGATMNARNTSPPRTTMTHKKVVERFFFSGM